MIDSSTSILLRELLVVHALQQAELFRIDTLSVARRYD